MENLPIKMYAENRPWGNFTEFTENAISTVKIIVVNANEELSLQYHLKRDEFWYVISGTGIATIGGLKKGLQPGATCIIPKHTQHRVKANNETLTFLEISFGTFDEKDIVRLEDRYGRN